MTALSLKGPDGPGGSTFPVMPRAWRVTPDPVDLEAAGEAALANGGRIGDIYLSLSGDLYVLVNSSGVVALEWNASLAGPIGPQGPPGAGAAHTATDHGQPAGGWRWQAPDYEALAKGPDETNVDVTTYPVV